MTTESVLIAIIRAETIATLVLWLKVLFHYGRAARSEWIVQGGRRRGLFLELVHPFTWAWRQFLSKFGLTSRHEEGPFETYTPYTPGVILRFAIWAAALGPFLSFFRVFMPSVNQPAHVSVLLLSTTIFAATNFGALAHLYVAHRTDPNRWMWIAVLFTIWCVVGPLLTYFLWPSPSPIIKD